EDGIRDPLVTGVQTCALPILALTGMSDGRAELVVDGSPTPVDAAFLDHHWFGRAHVFWRDFEALGPAFGHESHGAPVARLQALRSEERRVGKGARARVTEWKT